MTFRTILVGLLAAFCATFATVGFMVMYFNRPTQAAVETSKHLIVAKVDLELGQEIQENMLSKVEWFSDELPAGAFAETETIVGKFVTIPMVGGETIMARKIAETATNLQCGEGMRAIAIEVKSVSTSVGQNLLPGNRVDIIWQSNNRLPADIDPFALRILQNVKILSVGDVKNGAQGKSITLEVTPKMDENLIYAQSCGTLALSLLNPNDSEGVDPVEAVNLKTLLDEKRQSLEQPPVPPTPAWESPFNELLAQFSQLKTDLEQNPVEPTVPEEKRTAFDKIAKGMRAITIRTPDESSGVAGLLQPGDRVDLHFSLNDKAKVDERSYRQFGTKLAAVCTMIENIEVLAVDTQLYESDDAERKEMSQSVTLVVPEAMQHEIARAERLGSITLSLRGKEDRVDGPPRMLMSVDEFMAQNIPLPKAPVQQDSPMKIRTYRGSSFSEVVLYPLGT